jgi:tRNA 2-thiouridine synthesizing protein E
MELKRIRGGIKTQIKSGKIYELFPSGPAKGACKVAGLPKPTGCV